MSETRPSIGNWTGSATHDVHPSAKTPDGQSPSARRLRSFPTSSCRRHRCSSSHARNDPEHQDLISIGKFSTGLRWIVQALYRSRRRDSHRTSSTRSVDPLESPSFSPVPISAFHRRMRL
nr:hypothetical protein CFP56_04320 [Quercus suber]